MCRHGDVAAAEKSDSHKNFEAALDAVANASATGLPETTGVRMYTGPRHVNVTPCLPRRSRGASRVTRVGRRLSTVNKQLSNVALASVNSTNSRSSQLSSEIDVQMKQIAPPPPPVM